MKFIINKLKIKLLNKICLIGLPFLFSCSTGNNSEDINVSEIKEPCDCVKAFDVAASDMLDLLSQYDNMEDFKKDNAAVEKGKKIKSKYEEIDDRCDELQFKKKDFKDCDGYKAVEDKMKEINHKMRL